MPPRIWLIGGTQESAELARLLVQKTLPCLVTVTTEAARSLYPCHPLLHIWVGQLTHDHIPLFLQQHQIIAILDASHPFAVAISDLAIAITTAHHLPYLRYERPAFRSGADLIPTTEQQTVGSFEQLLQSNSLEGQRVLLTIGYRPLPLFQPWGDRATLFARILPSITALQAALAAGFSPDRLIALRPPISANLERALWQHWQISMVITKASGAAGGEEVKRQIAAELGVKLVVVDRPAIAYPQQTSDLKTALTFCQQAYGTTPMGEA